MSNWGPGGRGDFLRNRAASEDGEEETGEVTEVIEPNPSGGPPPHHHHQQPPLPPSHHHRVPSPVGSLSRHGGDFRDNFRGGRGGGGRFGGRGRRQRNSFSGGAFHSRDFRNDQNLHRDTSFGSSGGPPLPIHHRDSSFSSTGPRGGFSRDGPGAPDLPFRDPPGPREGGPRDGPFRDTPPSLATRDGSLFSRTSSFPGQGGMRDGFPAQRGERDIPPGGGLDRPTEVSREPSFGPGGLPRDSSFGQGGGRGSFSLRGPEGRDSSATYLHQNPPNRLDNRPIPGVTSPNPSGAPLSRPTDPRRRATGNEAGLAFHQGGLVPSASSEGMAGIAGIERRSSYNDISHPPGIERRSSYNDVSQPLGIERRSSYNEVPQPPLPPSPSNARRQSSYSSLASEGHSTLLNRPLGSFRSPGGGVRRAVSETAFRGEKIDLPAGISKPRSPGERGRSMPISGTIDTSPPQYGSVRPQGTVFEADRQFSATSNIIPRTNDPRFKRADESNETAPHIRQEPGALPSISERSPAEEPVISATTDPFGRTREWPQKLPVAARSTSANYQQSSPIASRPVKSQVSSPSTDKGISSVPKLPSPQAADGEPPKTKHEPLPPILISALGTPEKIYRAQAVLVHFHELVPGNEPSTDVADAVQKLPSKAEIMSAVAAIENQIKEAEKESEDNEEAYKEAKKEEERRKAEEVTKREEMQKKMQLEEEKRLEVRKVEEEKLKAKVEEEAEEELNARLADEKKQLEESFDGQLQKAKVEEKARHEDDLKTRVSEATISFDDSVAKAKRYLDKSKANAQKVSKKLAAAEAEYKAMVEIEEKKSRKRKNSSLKGFIPVETVVEIVMTENRRKAKEAHMLGLSMSNSILDLNRSAEACNQVEDSLKEAKDPKYRKTFEEWSVMTNQVTGISDALYTEPSEAPYYEQNEKNHSLIGPLVKEYVRDKKRRLTEHWTVLAEEYEVRRRLYEKQRRKLTKKARGSITMTSRPSIIGNKEKERREVTEGKPPEPAARPSNNPYRRARRGNEVRSEYEQEQIIAEIAAKEAMEKRITHGGSRIPRQICPLEMELTATYVNTFNSQRVLDPVMEMEEERRTNRWTDMEKCIFLDRFLQFPKDFRRIASFLRNKTTKDCVAFYYDSKQTVPYKGALKEHMLRRKRKGDYQVWDASIQAAISVGGAVSAGEDEEKPVRFTVPASSMTFDTRMLHPIYREVLDSMVVDESIAAQYKGAGVSDDTKWKSRKRGRGDPLFSLDKEQTKYLRESSQESLTNKPMKSPDEVDGTDDEAKITENESAALTPVKKATQKQKWSSDEKQVFIDTLRQHGRDWTMLANAVGTKSISQIKNFYYDYKKQTGKQGLKGEKKVGKETTPKSKDDKGLKTEKLEGKGAKKRRTPPSVPNLDSRQSHSPKLTAPTPSSNVEPPSTFVRQDENSGITEEMLVNPHFQHQHFLQQRQQELLQRHGLLHRHQELQELQRQQAELEQGEHQFGDTDNRIDLTGSTSRSELGERLLAGSSEYGSDLIQQLLNRQQSQSQTQQSHHGLQLQQQPQQSALQQLLSRQHIQREQQQQQQQQASHRSLEEARRLLGQQSQQQVLSNMFPGWSPASQLYQAQSRMQHAQLAAALQDGGGAMGSTTTMSDLSDVASIQRLLQMQQSQQQQQQHHHQSNPLLGLGQNHSQLGSLLGLSSAAGSGLSAGLLAHLEGLGANRAGAAQSDQAHEDLSTILARYGSASGGNDAQLGGVGSHLLLGGNVAGSATPDSAPSVSDAFALLQRAMQRENATNHGFGQGGRPDNSSDHYHG
ncbi:Myb-like DNA-binding protein [Nitzschia inconspicua]|uniref:Myb-like DNA-binding protein n=1 Tax=Nitzschia inconspicua TaxID=303405 RepID=A0A9K3LQQ7_9STRA|nr:Myb-like DNA-binding protein [Nitzschia inconspicua]